jgi:hypothetical protein
MTGKIQIPAPSKTTAVAPEVHKTNTPISIPGVPAPTSTAQVPKDPNALLSGDQLLKTLVFKHHSIRVIKRTDPSQFIPYFDDCTCGYQARLYSEGVAVAVAQAHIDWVTAHPTRI